jgi:predicted porin
MLVPAVAVPFLVAGIANAQSVQTPAPGTIVVHLNGRFQSSLVDYGSSVNTTTTSTGTSKLNPVSMGGEVRFYPGFDAQTLSGIQYGTQFDIRVASSNPGVGQNGNAPAANNSVPNQSSLYMPRAYGYIGTKTYGYLRFGETDAATSLLQAGVIFNFGDGFGWETKDGIALPIPTNTEPSATIVFANYSGLYSTDKVVYVSPQFRGFSAIVSYEPNSNGIKEGYANSTVASSSCAALTSSPNPTDIGSRRQNTVDAGLQYAIKQNGIVAKFGGTYLHGATINYTGTTAAAIAAGNTALVYGYDPLTVYQIGGQVAYAGFTLGGNIKTGQVNDSYTFLPKGARGAFAWTGGLTYTTGPYVVGVMYFESQTAGTYDPTKLGTEARTLSEGGVVVGADYLMGKNMSLFTQYMYGQRRQYGNTSVGNGVSGNAQAQVIGMGANMTW